MRLTNEQLENIKKKYNISQLWSWSRISSWANGKYNWYLNYIKKEEPDNDNCIYGTAGGFFHEILEDLYSGKLKYEDMPERFEEDWFMAREILGLKFDRNNPEQDEKLANNYYNNLKHFYSHYNMIDKNVICEDFALIKIGDNILQGYIDAYTKDEDGTITITDFKTSTIYRGDNLIEKSGQLVAYGISFLQQGIPMEKIKPRFNFLKYVTLTYEQKNGNIKTSNVERRLLGEKVQSCSKIWLKHFGYEPDKYLMELIDNNGDISILPLEVQDKIQITDCYVYVPFNREQIDYWTDKICNTINEIENTIDEYNILGEDESVFYDSIEDIEKESYFYATLSSYSASKNPCYARYLEKLQDKAQPNIFD